MIRPGRMIQQVLRSITRKAATVKYPFGKAPMPPHFRGRLTFYADKCIGCRLCMKDCPTNAINIRKIADKQFEADIDMGKCIYCAQCVDSCPKKALESTSDFELAQIDRDKLKVTYDSPRKASPAGESAPAEPPAKVPS